MKSFALSLTLFVCFACLTASAQPVFRAGAVAIDISPQQLPVRIAGQFLEGTGTKVNDALHARCIVLDDGGTQIALAIVDTCMMQQSLIDEAKKLASAGCGIAMDHIMVSATHTHSAPAAMACLGTRQDPAYAAFLPGKIAEGIIAASKQLQPARIGWGSMDDWADTHNRRWIRKQGSAISDPFGEANGQANMHPGYESTEVIGPSGPVDPQLSVLSIQTKEGKPLALLANYSQHYFGSSAVSADYFGLFCKEMAQLLEQPGEGSAGFICAMSQGTSGDLMWMDYGSPKKSITLQSYTEGVAKLAQAALKKIDYHNHVPLGMVEKVLPLGYRLPDAKRLDWAKRITAQIENDLPKDKTQVYANEAMILDGRKTTSLKLQAIRIGELTIATLPNEVYSLTGLKLKAQAPLAAHFNIELANGAEGYIPPPEQHALGGYTTWPARTAGLEVQAEPKIMATLLGALAEVAGKPCRAMQAESGDFAEAVLAMKPTAYWRLDDAAGDSLANAVAGGSAATLTPGFALYLPGVGSGTGAGLGERLTPSAFSGKRQINRAVHLVGGEIRTSIEKLGDHYSTALWVWLGEPSGASARSGTLIDGAGGERLTVNQFSDHRVQFQLGEATSKAELRADDWHLVVLVRDGAELRLHLDGATKPEIVTAFKAEAEALLPAFGHGLQGKLDEIAMFNKVLKPAAIASLWEESGIAEAREKAIAAREREARENAKRSQPPQFAMGYDAVIAKLKPVLHSRLDGVNETLKIEGGIKLTPASYAVCDAGRLSGKIDSLGKAWSVSLWFKNERPNDAEAVTAYLFSRGPAGDKQCPGDHFGIAGTYERAHAGKLVCYNGNVAKELLAGRTVVPPNTWNHAVLVRDGARLRVFLNGDATPEIDAEMKLTAEGVKEIFVGARNDMLAPLKGCMAELAVFDRALTNAEAVQLHQASGQPKSSSKAVAATSLVAKPEPLKLASLPLTPTESMAKIHIRDGYEVQLVAAEPVVLDPVAFDWDDQGRMWVVEMADYPLGMDGKGKSGGRVRVLSNPDKDGRYTHSKVFAEGLNFPTGILVWRDGIMVTAAPSILWLQDKDGDGVADERREMFKGFSEGNQQLRVNGLRWGMDGWVYCAGGAHTGNYNKATEILCVQTGKKVALGSRDFRFNPDTGEFEPQSGPSQFGRCRDDWDHWFGVQNSFPLWHYVLSDSYLQRNPHVVPPDPVQQLFARNPRVYPASAAEKRFHSFDQAGRFTSACGIEIYKDSVLFETQSETGILPVSNKSETGSLPVQANATGWQPVSLLHAFTCEPFHNVVQHNLLADDGVSFKATRDASDETADFFASEDRWTRPVMVRTGPDGALYIADMYRYMIEHPQWLPQNGKDELLPFYREGDDRGRIYRVVKKGSAASVVATHDPITDLASSNGWLRDLAQRKLLNLKRADHEEGVWALTKHALPQVRAQAAWTLMLWYEADAAKAASPRMTRNPWPAAFEKIVLIALRDGEARVREQGLVMAERHPSLPVIEAAAALVEDRDAKVRLQLACTLGEWKEPKAGEVLASLLKHDADNPIIIGAAMTSAMPHLLTLAKANVSSTLAALAPMAVKAGNDEAVMLLTRPMFPEGLHAVDASLLPFHTFLTSLKQVGIDYRAYANQKHSEDFNKRLAQLDHFFDLALEWSANSAHDAVEPLTRIAEIPMLADETLAKRGYEQLHKMLSSTSANAQAAAVAVLTRHPNDAAHGWLLGLWDSATPALRPALLEALMADGKGAQQLLDAINAGRILPTALDAQQQARLLNHPQKQIQARAAETFASSAAISKRADVLAKYKPALTLKGDAAKGKTAFAMTCIACHQLEGVGLPLGPDLRSVVQHDKDKLLHSILDPSAIIEPGFTAYHCTLKGGEQLYGIITTETSTSITMKLPGNVVRSLLRAEISELKSTNTSLMPDGLEAALTPQAVADMIAYLQKPKQ